MNSPGLRRSALKVAASGPRSLFGALQVLGLVSVASALEPVEELLVVYLDMNCGSLTLPTSVLVAPLSIWPMPLGTVVDRSMKVISSMLEA